MYISWAAYYEGRTDSSYFNILIPRLLDAILRNDGIRPYDIGMSPSVQFGISNRAFEAVSTDICSRLDEFHLLFVHADYGGRALQQTIQQRREALIEAAIRECDFDQNTAVFISPLKELEAWALADRKAVETAFGVHSLPPNLLPNSPKEAERLDDPKSVLQAISRHVGRKRVDTTGILVRIAQEQDIEHLRTASSFAEFEKSLRESLRHIGCII